MKSKLILGLAIVSLMATAATAQQNPAAPANPASADAVSGAPTSPHNLRGQWRASKLIGVDVYNDQNEKLGDIAELIVDRSGKISGVIIGVGGFLGMGERHIVVNMEKLKFLEEPVRSAARSDANRPSTNDRAERGQREDNRRVRDDWYPDHAVMSGATKDSVKNMSEFKYD